MLEFYKPEIRDRDWIQPLLSASGGMGSQDAFGTLFIWAGNLVPGPKMSAPMPLPLFMQ